MWENFREHYRMMGIFHWFGRITLGLTTILVKYTYIKYIINKNSCEGLQIIASANPYIR